MNNYIPKVTALVPSYNHGGYIRERIESILNQTYPNIELIVIDDCSDDNSHAVINKMQSTHGFKYLRRSKNSGTPFAAWEDVCDLSTGDFIWICESDDVAKPSFLEIAVKSLTEIPEAVMFYCSSHVIDEEGEQVGHTDGYFHDVWNETRWDTDFIIDGPTELLNFQLRGQIVPNMSSALFTTKAFKSAFTPFIKRLRLTGDWLFIGEVLKFGKVVFVHDTLSYFRKHEVTARVRVKSARSQAEFILTKCRLFRTSGLPVSGFASLIGTDVVRFFYEPAGWPAVLKTIIQISWIESLRFSFLLFVSVCLNPSYINQFRKRYKQSKIGENS